MTEQQARKYRTIIEFGAQTLDDARALTVKTLYPEWEADMAYTAANGKPVGYKVVRDRKLWKLRQ